MSGHSSTDSSTVESAAHRVRDCRPATAVVVSSASIDDIIVSAYKGDHVFVCWIL